MATQNHTHSSMTPQEWYKLASACADILNIVHAHGDEVTQAFKASGSNYRLGSFHAPLHVLFEIADKEHKKGHAAKTKQV